MWTQNNKGPITENWGTSAFTAVHPEACPLRTTL